MAPPLNKRVQMVRGTTAESDQYTGPSAQITVDSERNELRLHDGRTKGGWRIPNLTQLRRLFLSRDSEFGSITFADEEVGLMTRVGTKVYQLRKLIGLNGVRITNEDGAAGHPTIDVPLPFAQDLTPIADANLAEKTGFYIVTKSTVGNVPAAWTNLNDVALIVINYEDTDGGTVFQIARNPQLQDEVEYTRRRVGGVWGNWGTSSADSAPGSFTQMMNGVDERARLWSASNLARFIRTMMQSLQYIDASNVAKALSYNDLFTQAGAGDGTTSTVFGVFSMATNDRFEIVCSATARSLPAGETVFAKIELEKSDLSWEVLVNQPVTSLPNQPANNGVFRQRFTKTATGYNLADDSWVNVGAAVTVALTGNIRVTSGAVNTIGARAARWRF